MIKFLFLLSFLFINFDLSYSQNTFCSQLVPNIDPSQLPKLPLEFETRIELNIVNQQRSEDLYVLFDSYDKKAELIKRDQNSTIRTIFYFDKNEQFTLQNGICSAVRLNESNQNLFFGLDNNGFNGINMKPPNYFFHFNNGFPHVKLEQTTWRGIPVTHFQSCQNWPEINANVLVDYYFSLPSHTFPITYTDSLFQEIPVGAVIEGYINNNQPEPTKIRHEYNFYEFRTIVERKSDLFLLPEGIYCDGQTYKEEFPDYFPKSFSFYEEITDRNLNIQNNARFSYNYNLKTVRYDLTGFKSIDGEFSDAPYKFIHDFNSGVGYAINKQNQNCKMYPIGTYPIERNEIFASTNQEYLSELKPPASMFFLDDTYFYSGQRYVRDILCDVFISKRKDIIIQNVSADYFIVELYLQNQMTSVDQGLDQLEQVVPISIRITAPGTKLNIINHIYEFDSTYYRERFDISDCFQGKNKKLFGIRFKYPNDLSQEEFDKNYGRLLMVPFEQAIMNSFGSFEASPLRIVSPRIESNKNGFTIYSGVISSASEINHFRKLENVRIDNSKVRYKYRVDSPEKCAAICLNRNSMNSLTNNNDFRCRSFDFCAETSSTDFYCSFYNSTVTDSDVIIQTSSECQHYSKITKTYDSASIDELYRSVQESIIRKTFKISFNVSNAIMQTFNGTEIFDANLQVQSSTDQIGSTNYFSRFDLLVKNSDFNELAIQENKEIGFRKKSQVSVDECARLCINEPTFDCQSMTHSSELLDCKWSSLTVLNSNSSVYLNDSIEGTSLFIRDPLYNYIEYPFKVTALVDYSVVDVASANECAFKCDREKKIKCRSFNLCKKDDTTFRCLLSESNIHNTEKDPNIVYTAICSHYSKRAINDFQEVAQTQLSVIPQSKLTNTTIESCAEICTFEDNYFCRSFDFYVDTNTCYLYKENLKDKYITDLGVKPNPSCNHFSRLYYEENGILKTVEALKKVSKEQKYSGGTIFGVVFAVIIGGLLFGAILGFVYLKVTNKSDFLPVMKFVNPNYNQSE